MPAVHAAVPTVLTDIRYAVAVSLIQSLAVCCSHLQVIGRYLPCILARLLNEQGGK